MHYSDQIHHVVTEGELSTNQRRYDYGSRDDGQPIYIGVVPISTTTTESKWIIRKYTYDENDNVTLEQTAVNVSWDDRVTTTYA